MAHGIETLKLFLVCEGAGFSKDIEEITGLLYNNFVI